MSEKLLLMFNRKLTLQERLDLGNEDLKQEKEKLEKEKEQIEKKKQQDMIFLKYIKQELIKMEKENKNNVIKVNGIIINKQNKIKLYKYTKHATIKGYITNCIKNNKDTEYLKFLVGLNLKQFKEHLEKQFTEKMSWSNRGVKGWHIDHIIPSCMFDPFNEEELLKCYHYTNQQPLWCTDNMEKSNKIK